MQMGVHGFWGNTLTIITIAHRRLPIARKRFDVTTVDRIVGMFLQGMIKSNCLTQAFLIAGCTEMLS